MKIMDVEILNEPEGSIDDPVLNTPSLFHDKEHAARFFGRILRIVEESIKEEIKNGKTGSLNE